MIYKIQFFIKVCAETFNNRSFIDFIVAYLENREIYIYITRAQHVLGFISIGANFI